MTNPPLDTNKGEPMKTLPEIVQSLVKQNGAELLHERLAHPSVIEAQEAIVKELMGCLPEKKPDRSTADHDSGCDLQMLNDYDDMGASCTCPVGSYNQALDEVRARLTAFIGHRENK